MYYNIDDRVENSWWEVIYILVQKLLGRDYIILCRGQCRKFWGGGGVGGGGYILHLKNAFDKKFLTPFPAKEIKGKLLVQKEKVHIFCKCRMIDDGRM